MSNHIIHPIKQWMNDLLPQQLPSHTQRKIQSDLSRLSRWHTLVVSAVYLFVSEVWFYLGQQLECWVLNSWSKQLSAEMRLAWWYIISNQVYYVFFLIWLWYVEKRFLKSWLRVLCILLTYICLQALVFALRSCNVSFFNVLPSSNNSNFCSFSS